jgi:hypothetical protein
MRHARLALYHPAVGSLKTSEQADAVAGEGRKDARADHRPVDSGAKIIIAETPPSGTPIVPPPAPARPLPRAATPAPAAGDEPRRGGLWLVILLYILSAAALGFAIYERFVA